MDDRRLTVYAELRLLVPLPLRSLEEQPMDVPPPKSWLDNSITRRLERRGEGAHIPIFSTGPADCHAEGRNSLEIIATTQKVHLRITL